MTPLMFVPHLSRQLWGGRRLQTVLGKSLPADGDFGESWELSGHPLHVSQVSAGPHAGRSVNDVWAEFGAGWTPSGDQRGQCPLVIRWLDCEGLLPVCIISNPAGGRRSDVRKPGSSRVWVVLQADPEARIYAGLKAGVDREEFVRRAGDGTLADCLHQVTPQRGDVLHVPAGCVHAAGRGLLLAEIQPTDLAVLRLFDWNRLPSEDALLLSSANAAFEGVDWSSGPVDPLHRIELDDFQQPGLQPLLDGSDFRMEALRLRAQSLTIRSERAAIFMTILGAATIGADAALTLPPGSAALFTPGEAEWTLRAPGDAVILAIWPA